MKLHDLFKFPILQGPMNGGATTPELRVSPCGL